MKLKRITSFGICVAICSSMCFSVTAASNTLLMYDEDFENYRVGTKLSDLNIGWTVSDSQTGDKVTIETDPISGSKAVRIEQTKQKPSKSGNQPTGFVLDGFDKITEGIVDVSFKMRKEHDGALLPKNFLGIDNEYRLLQINSAMYFKEIKWDTTKYWGGDCKAAYTQWNLTFDFVNGRLGIKSTNSGEIDVEHNPGGYSGVQFMIAANWHDGEAGWIGGSEGVNPVYWIDDIKVSKRGVRIVSETIKDGSKNVGVDKKLSIVLDKKIKDVGLSDNIKVYKNEALIDNYSVSVNDTMVDFEFENGFDYNSDYKVEIKKIEAQESGNLPIENYSLNFKTERMFDEISDLKNGESYASKIITLPTGKNAVISAELENSKGDVVRYVSGTPITEIDEYTLTVTGVNNENNKIQIDVYKFKIVGEIEPKASEVKITSDKKPIGASSTLVGSYEYYDVNKDDEGESIYRWYSCDTIDGEYKKIFESKKSESNISYTLTEKDMNKYIKFSVTPISVKEPFMGEEVFSDVFVGFFTATPKNASIAGKAELNGKLIAKYEYTDINGYEDITEKYQWYKKTGKDFEKIVGETEQVYTISEKDIDCSFKVGVTLLKDNIEGKEILSQELAGLYSPEVSDVKITGSAQNGQSLYLTYAYTDKNNDDEGNTKIVWYVDGEEAETGNSIALTAEMKGKSIYAAVTPVSVSFPFEGKSVLSETKKVGSAQASGGSGGGGGAAPRVDAIKVPSTADKNNNGIQKPQEAIKPTDKKEFSDIKGHWAEKIINEMLEKGYIKGMDENSFAPDEYVTRAQFATMLVNIFELWDKPETNQFTDVFENDWYYSSVQAVSNNIMTGSNKKFRPQHFITRQEIAVVMMNLAKSINMYRAAENKAVFDDRGDIAQWAEEAVDYAYEQQLIFGKEDNRFAPTENATRAESITLIKRMYDKIGGSVDEE